MKSVDLVNGNIRATTILLIDENGENRGVFVTKFALQHAISKGLDLVQVSSSVPPVCKIMDYGKYKYEKAKKEHHHVQKDDTKEMRIGYNIGEHDIAFKHKKILEFLAEDYKVKYVFTLKNREQQMVTLAIEKMKELLKTFELYATWDEKFSISHGKDNGGQRALIIQTILMPIKK